MKNNKSIFALRRASRALQLKKAQTDLFSLKPRERLISGTKYYVVGPTSGRGREHSATIVATGSSQKDALTRWELFMLNDALEGDSIESIDKEFLDTIKLQDLAIFDAYVEGDGAYWGVSSNETDPAIVLQKAKAFIADHLNDPDSSAVGAFELI